jgi:RNA polymerase sigma factor (sigma-70 family)
MATVADEAPVLARDEAFEQLYRQYVKDVYHYALALLRNPADAEDVTQTTFLNAYRAFQRGEEIVKPHNWLIKIAHNVARSRYARSTRRVKEVPLEEHLDELALPDDERPNVEGILRALGRLPFNQRAAIVMRELEGRSYVEIGDTLGVSVAAVETLIFRARRSLRVRASELRSLGAIPLPASLAQLFEGGGVVAGGIGTGFLLKAAVALVAGSLATGLGGDRARRAVAGEPGQAPSPTSTQTTRTTGPSAGSSRHPVAHRSASHARRVAVRESGQVRLNSDSLGGPAPGPAADSTQQSSPPAPTATVTETVDSTVATVEETVTTVAATIPATLPVQPPALPPLPVQPPPLPQLP